MAVGEEEGWGERAKDREEGVGGGGGAGGGAGGGRGGEWKLIDKDT